MACTEEQTCRQLSVLALFQRRGQNLSVFSVVFHFSASKTARKEGRKCRLFAKNSAKRRLFGQKQREKTTFSAKRRHFRTENCTDCTGVQFRADLSAIALISARDQREILFSFMFSARKQREMPIFPNQRGFALRKQREQKGCCRHV